MHLQTIIEALKHACTGELPPNARSGQSFVHDPKVWITTEASVLYMSLVQTKTSIEKQETEKLKAESRNKKDLKQRTKNKGQKTCYLLTFPC
jgi:hypothetical protein